MTLGYWIMKILVKLKKSSSLFSKRKKYKCLSYNKQFDIFCFLVPKKKKKMRKEMATDFVFIITRLTVPTLNQYFPIMLLVSHWIPGKFYRGKQAYSTLLLWCLVGNYSFPHIIETVFTLQNLFPILTSNGVYFFFYCYLNTQLISKVNWPCIWYINVCMC